MTEWIAGESDAKRSREPTDEGKRLDSLEAALVRSGKASRGVALDVPCDP